MELIVRKQSKQEFLPIYTKWLEQHQFPTNCASIMPENFFVCYSDKTPIYAIPFWHTDSKIAIIAFIVSNKKANYKFKKGGLDYLIQQVISYAKRKKYISLFSSTTNETIIKSFDNNGFVKGDSDCQFFKTI
jgi:hypothetical protein